MSESQTRIRSRIIPHKRSGVQPLGKIYPWNSNIPGWHPSPNQTFTVDLNLNYSKGEVCLDELHPGPPYRSGGPFKHLLIERVSPYAIQGNGTYLRMSDASPSAWQKYVGGFGPPGESSIGGAEVSNPNTALSATSSLIPAISGYESQAWSRTKPRIERSNAFVSLAEARDLPRMLQQTAQGFHLIWKSMGGSISDGIMSPKKLADQFLNEQFGWVPFLSDLRQLYAAYHGSDRYMRHMSLRNGKPTRRQASILDTRTEIKDVQRSGTGMIINPVLNANFFSVSPTYEVTEIVETQVRASGRFSFYRPEFDTGLNEYNSAWFAVNRQLTMYGLRISPSNIWRATPWTWLIDWISNVSDHIDLLTDMAVDSVVCHYLYLTQHQLTKRILTQNLPFQQTGNLSLSWEKVIDSKERKGTSSPYGFSLTWDNLTPRQLAILGALGISRNG